MTKHKKFIGKVWNGYDLHIETCIICPPFAGNGFGAKITGLYKDGSDVMEECRDKFRKSYYGKSEKEAAEKSLIHFKDLTNSK